MMTRQAEEPLPVDKDRPYLGGPEPAVEFGRLFDAYARPLHRYLARRVGQDTAHDLVSGWLRERSNGCVIEVSPLSRDRHCCAQPVSCLFDRISHKRHCRR